MNINQGLVNLRERLEIKIKDDKQACRVYKNDILIKLSSDRPWRVDISELAKELRVIQNSLYTYEALVSDIDLQISIIEIKQQDDDYGKGEPEIKTI